MSSVSAGIDFGTTNSAVAVSVGSAVPRLVSFDGKPTIPSALFYPDDKSGVLFGEQALQAYLSGREGRFMRSLKRVLGTDLMTVGTTVNGRPRRFENILAQFISYLKNTAENNLQAEISKVVMGRPVHFATMTQPAMPEPKTNWKTLPVRLVSRRSASSTSRLPQPLHMKRNFRAKNLPALQTSAAVHRILLLSALVPDCPPKMTGGTIFCPQAVSASAATILTAI